MSLKTKLRFKETIEPAASCRLYYRHLSSADTKKKRPLSHGNLDCQYLRMFNS
jgi:hypothetical protein